MSNDPLKAVHSFVERAYVRLQAGDMLVRCLDERSSNPMQQMVEGLVLAGPQSLATLQEILAEVGRRKSQVNDDIHQVFSELENNLKSYGVHLTGLRSVMAITRLTPMRFMVLLREQNVTDGETETACLQMLREGRSLIKNLATHLHLLDEIETYLRDWIWGLAYESAHRGMNAGAPLNVGDRSL
jgi:hypothetical protein